MANSAFDFGTAEVGQVLQVVQGTLTTPATSTSSVMADTGLTATITPTSNINRILVIVMIGGSANLATTSLGLNLVRNAATNIFLGTAAGNRMQLTQSMTSSQSAAMDSGILMYLDSPATNAATIYKVQFNSQFNANGVAINSTLTDSNLAAYPRTASSITLMEVKV